MLTCKMRWQTDRRHSQRFHQKKIGVLDHPHCCVCLFCPRFRSGNTILNPIICAAIFRQDGRGSHMPVGGHTACTMSGYATDIAPEPDAAKTAAQSTEMEYTARGFEAKKNTPHTLSSHYFPTRRHTSPAHPTVFYARFPRHDHSFPRVRSKTV